MNKHSQFCCTSIAALGIILTSPVYAQSAGNATPEAISLDAAFEQARLINGGGPLDKDGAGGGDENGLSSKLQLAANEGNVFADLSLSYDHGKIDPGQPNRDGDYTIRARLGHLTVKASVPINKTEARSFADFKQIGDDAKLGINYTSYHTSRVSGKGYHTELKKFARTCLIEAGTKWLLEQFPAPTENQKDEGRAVIEKYDQFLVGNLPTWAGAVQQAAGVKNVKGEELAPNFGPIALAACGQGQGTISGQKDLEVRFAKKTYSDSESYNAFRKKYNQQERMIFWGLSGNAGYEKYDVLDQTSFRVDTINRVGFDASGFVGMITKNGDFSVRLSGGYSRGFEPKDAIDFCRSTGGGNQECINGQDGRPVRKSTAYAKAEMRLVAMRDEQGRPRIAVAPEIAFDAKKNDWVIDLPIYLQRNEAKGLDGGIRLGYATKDKDFGIGVFVGIPFSSWF